MADDTDPATETRDIAEARMALIMARESELGAFDLEAVRQLGRYVI